MKILIATRNMAKYKSLKNVLGKSILKGADFYSFDDIKEEIIDKEEVGTLEERGYQKAKNTYDNLKNNDFEYIIANDEGLEVKGVIIEDVKKYIEQIVTGKLLVDGEIINIIKAFTFINKDGKIKSVAGKIPFKYIKVQEQFEIKENTYPLNKVLSLIHKNESIENIKEEEAREYTINHIQKELLSVKEYYDIKE